MIRWLPVLCILALTCLPLPVVGSDVPIEIPDDGHVVPLLLDEAPPSATRQVPLPATFDWQADLERAVGGLAWGDADGDGDLDLAVGCYYAQSYPPVTDWENLVYINHGGMLETTPTWVSADERSTTDVRWADIDGDYRPDLIAANGDFSFDPSVIYFNGPSGLSTSPGWLAGDATWTLGAAAADYDNDGDLDVAFGNQAASPDPYRPVSLFRNLGTTLETTPSWLSADPCITNCVAWGDVDGAGVVPRSIAYSGDGSRKVFHVRDLPMEGPVTVEVAWQQVHHVCYDPIAGWVSLPFAPPTGAPILISYQNSTEPDLAVSKWVNFESGIYFNTSGTLASTTGWTTGSTQSDKGIGWADVEGDGDLDLAIGASSYPTSLYLNDGTMMEASPAWQSQESYFSCQDLAWGDVDGDGDLDLATVHFGNGHARVYLNHDGALDRHASWYYDCSSSATAIAWGDMNGDGNLDLAVGTARQPVMVFLNTTPTGVSDGSDPSDRSDGSDLSELSISPQPFSPSGVVSFSMPVASEVNLSVCDVKGRRVRVLDTGTRSEGTHQVGWDGRDDAGHDVAPGLYFVRLSAGERVEVKRIVVVR